MVFLHNANDRFGLKTLNKNRGAMYIRTTVKVYYVAGRPNYKRQYLTVPVP